MGQQFSHNSSQNLVHEALEGEWSITKTKGHHQNLIMPFMCVKNNLDNVHFINSDLVLYITKVLYVEEHSAMKLIHEIINHCNG